MKEARLREAGDLVEALGRVRAGTMLERVYGGLHREGREGGPYDWQVEFHNASRYYGERAILAGNRVGKSRSAAADVAIHLTGRYPKWWGGRVFSKPVEVLCAGESNETTRDIIQKALFGEMSEGERRPSGYGWVPESCIGDFAFRQCGVRNVLDYVRVEHVSGGWSTCKLKAFEQGATKFQGTTFGLAWLDEEPEQKDKDLFSEVQARLMIENGLLIWTRTPLFGETEMVRYFRSGKPGIWYKTVSWDDAPHMSLEMKAAWLAKFPEHERDARSKGIAMLGSGGVYNVPDEVIACDPFEIPGYYRRICGVDFGIDHPGAAVWIAIDGDSQTVYVYDCYRARDQVAAYHSQAIKDRGPWIPVVWPHDGMIRDKGSGGNLKKLFSDHGVNMLQLSARYDDAKGGGQGTEPVAMEILEMMRTGRFKVFRHLKDWFEEKRMYHRKDGFIVKRNDDLLAATHYAVMMRRYAAAKVDKSHEDQIVVSGYSPLDAFL